MTKAFARRRREGGSEPSSSSRDAPFGPARGVESKTEIGVESERGVAQNQNETGVEPAVQHRMNLDLPLGEPGDFITPLKGPAERPGRG